MTTTLEPISVGSCPTCGGMAQFIAATPEQPAHTRAIKAAPETCGCPAGCHPLEHAIDWVLRRQDAPIPPMSMGETLKHLRDALDDWRNR